MGNRGRNSKARAGGAAGPAPVGAAAKVDGATISGEQFASEVKAAIADVPASGRFGDDRVFIGDAYDAAAKRMSNLSLDDFKRRLDQERKTGRIKLARADLVGAMNPAQVKRSEISLFGGSAIFNFIVP